MACKTLVLGGLEWTTKELFDYCKDLKSWGIRLQRGKCIPYKILCLDVEGIQVNKFANHDTCGGNYYYRVIYSRNMKGTWHKTTLTRLIPLLEHMSKHGFTLCL